MCWQCDHPHATIDDYLDVLRTIIADHGWAVQFVEDESRPFAYTVGLSLRGLPELLITGLQPRKSAHVLNSVAHYIADDGMVVQPAERIDLQGELLLEVVEVDHPDVHLTFAVRLRDAPIRVSTGLDRRPPPLAMGPRVEPGQAPATGAGRPHPAEGVRPRP